MTECFRLPYNVVPTSCGFYYPAVCKEQMDSWESKNKNQKSAGTETVSSMVKEGRLRRTGHGEHKLMNTCTVSNVWQWRLMLASCQEWWGKLRWPLSTGRTAWQ